MKRKLPPEFHEQPLTARMLDDFATCPRKFLLSFFTTRDAERHFRGGSAALHQAVRGALLEVYGVGGPAKAGVQALLDAFEAHWEGDLCADALEEEQLHSQGRRMLQEYAEDHQAESAAVVGTDVRLTATLGDQTFVAVADLVLRSELGVLQYLRFTSSRSPLGPAELAKDVSARLLWLLAHDQQADDAGEPTVSYYALRKRKAYEVVLSADEAEYARHDIISQVARIHREGEFDPRKGKYCRWCRSRARCPAWRR